MNKTLLTIFGCLIIFFATTFGASLVFFLKNNISKKLNCIISGFSAGIMVAASIWSLILPSIEYASYLKDWDFLPAAIGIVSGCLFLLVIDLIVRLINRKKNINSLESVKIKRFVIAFTLHNIPEGMAVGFAFGCALSGTSNAMFMGAIGLAVGIAIQNIPEGLAVALPVYKYSGSKKKGFFIGMISGIVEPLFAFISVLLASQIQGVLPWALAFSAGSMLFVSIEDLIPEAKYSESSHIGTWGFIVGFLIMMLLDILL